MAENNMKVIDPHVTVLDFGPTLTLEYEGKKIIVDTDTLVYAGALITYKDTKIFEEITELMAKGELDPAKVKNSLIKSAGAGHASMATTPGIWMYMGGDSSKFIDSIFTGVRFGSSLMPSGRRVEIKEEQILVPEGIANHSEEAVRIYERISKQNIQAYEKLMERGVPKQEAAKIVQYGHRGGGLAFMPLETLISCSKQAERNPESMPLEGRQILSQIEDFIMENGMGITYQARKDAPRESCPNPNIFTFNKNLAQELLERNSDALYSPKILGMRHIPSQERDQRIEKYLQRREQAFKSIDGVLNNWRSLQGEIQEIVSDFNGSFSAQILENVPWRVWGEFKRHRTMPQTAESIYNAVARSTEVVNKNVNLENIAEEYMPVLSLPPKVLADNESTKLWIDTYNDAIKAYNQLVSMGIAKSDAIALVPRGIKLGMYKELDLYNATTGELSLRTCHTAEPEMKRISLKETELLQERDLPYAIKSLFTPKCVYNGICPEDSKKSCNLIANHVKDYTLPGNLDYVKSIREAEMAARIDRK